MSDAIQPARPNTGAASKNEAPACPGRRGSTLLAGWIVFSAFCSCAGWLLSALHQLNVLGYAATFLLGLGAVWAFRGKLFPHGLPGCNLRKARLRKPLPLMFFVLAALALFGGVINTPSNYDALTYRVPRVLHWLAAGQWHWIYTDFNQVNTRACGIEWLSAPLLLFTRSERFLFLINAVSFCLLPGLVFSLFRQVGVRARVAWSWMWLLPTGYCYLLQAASISNDMFSAVYSLAALDYALRARRSGRISDVCLSGLAMALLTGAKASNLPLLLPWAVAILPTWRLWLRRPLAIAAVAIPMLGASFLPTIALNVAHCGDWTGMAAEARQLGKVPVWLTLTANSIMWTVSNLAPPVFPVASVWNRLAWAATPGSMRVLLEKHFEPGAAHWKLPEIQQEEDAGLGFGVTVLFALSVAAVLLRHRRKESGSALAGNDLWTRLLCFAPWISLLYLMSKLNMTGAVRYLAAYYPLLAMGLLRLPGHDVVVRQRWWRIWAGITCVLAALLLMVSPARPLWPARWFLEHYGSRLPQRLVALARNAYEAKAQRTQVFTPLIALLPADASVVGFVAADFPETSLWKPFGTRRILHVKLSDSGDDLRRRGIKYVLLTTDHLKEPYAQWLQERNARELNTLSLKMWGSLPPFTWRVVELSGQTNRPPESNPKL